MPTLILPVAGQSSRFPGMRPKWLLTMPDGKLMIEKSIEKLNIHRFDKVIITLLKEHIDAYLSDKALQSIAENIHPHVDFCVLNEPTKSQSETIAKTIQDMLIDDSIFIKDCDNMFSVDWHGSNQIAVLDLNHVGLIDAKNKSYVVADSLGYVSNIVEKKVMSHLFCCGGYGFEYAREFLEHYSLIAQKEEVYVSHVIYRMLMTGVLFQIQHASHYVDWGTLREYRHYMNAFVTVFCDIDGVLFQNGSKFGKQGWHTSVIHKNLQALARLHEEGRLYLVITSSRPESQKTYIQEKLAEMNLVAHQYVMNLPHTRRILVNDYSPTNPYPSALSINLERDSEGLSHMLNMMVG